MAYGRSPKKRTSRPIFPEYFDKYYASKRLLFYNQGSCYDREGKVVFLRSIHKEDLLEELVRQPTICFVESLANYDNIGLVVDFCGLPGISVLCSATGTPTMIRIQRNNSSSWIVSISAWDLPYEIESLNVIQDIYNHIGLGSSPTPSSLGRKAMRYIYRTHNLKRHTCLPLSCEEYVAKHGFGGISVTKHIGKSFSKVSELDAASMYLTEFITKEFPDGTPEWFVRLDDLSYFKTWFACVRITIPKRLSLGIFPVRRDDNSVYYPVNKGVYETHVWRETAEMAAENGCVVEVYEGWGWRHMTSDNEEWASWLYEKKTSSPSKIVEKGVKKVAVSGVGSFGRSRDNFLLSNEVAKDNEHALPVLIGNVPIDLWIVPSVDDTVAAMGHWQRYCVAVANNDVRSFAKPFADRGDLILIDTDAIFTKGEEAGKRYLEKHSIEAIGCEPGTWLWKLHHNFRVLRNRMWLSNEEPNRYGSLLERIFH